MAAIRQAAYELEPGEVPPFPAPYCQTDELEPGEIRQYALQPLQVQTSAYSFQPSQVQVLTQPFKPSQLQATAYTFQRLQVQPSTRTLQHLQVQPSAQTFQSSQSSADLYQCSEVQSSAHLHQSLQAQSSTHLYQSSQVQASGHAFQSLQVQPSTQTLQHLQVQPSAQTFQSSQSSAHLCQSSQVQASGHAFQSLLVQSSAQNFQVLEMQSSAETFQSSQVHDSHHLGQSSQVQSSPQTFHPSQLQASAHPNGVRRIQLLRTQTCWDNRVAQVQNSQETFPTSKRESYKIKKLEGLLLEWKNTLKTEREAFAVKLKRQSRKIQDLEIKTKFQQTELKEQKKARAVAEDMLKKTDEEKEALQVTMRSIEKEGCKMNRLLKQKDAELSKAKEVNEKNAFLWESKSKDLGNAEERINILESDNLALRKKNALAERELQVKYKELEDHQQLHDNEMNKLEHKITHCKSSHEKTTKKLRKDIKSLTQQSELWRSKFRQIKDEKAVINDKLKRCRNKCSRRGKIVEAEKATNAEIQTNIAALKKETGLLSQENGSLKEEIYNLRRYGGFVGSLRRVKRFFSRLADRLLS